MNSLSITLIPGLNGGASLASAHGGGVDGQGGHNNRSAGNYHFHRGPLDGRTFASKEDAAKVLPAYSPRAANEAGSDSPRSTEPLFFDLAPYRPYQSSDSQVIAHKAGYLPIQRGPSAGGLGPLPHHRRATTGQR